MGRDGAARHCSYCSYCGREQKMVCICLISRGLRVGVRATVKSRYCSRCRRTALLLGRKPALSPYLWPLKRAQTPDRLTYRKWVRLHERTRPLCSGHHHAKRERSARKGFGIPGLLLFLISEAHPARGSPLLRCPATRAPTIRPGAPETLATDGEQPYTQREPLANYLENNRSRNAP